MNLSSAVLATLAYHDIFDYPLTEDEIHRLLVYKTASSGEVSKNLDLLLSRKRIEKKGEFYSSKKRASIVKTRKSRDRISESKFTRAKFLANILKFVPHIKLVAVSGALAMKNSHKEDDIDLVIVSAKGSLWTSRFLANLLLFPSKRDPKGKKVADKACLNLFLDESDLKIRDQNIYQAHEICHMMPLWDRGGTYKKFIEANMWVGKYLPNWQPSFEIIDHRSEKKRLPTTNYQLSTVEKFLKTFQLWYMKNKLTTEKVSKTQLFFHPKNTQERVLTEYGRRLEKLGIASS